MFFSHQFSRNNNFYRKTSGIVNVILVLHQLFIICTEGYYLDNNPYRHKRVLGPKNSFVVEWNVNWKERVVNFQVSAETKGWLGFGLSKDGRMINSDVVIGGVGPDGKPYFDDAHIRDNRTVHIDKQQDWKLLGAWEKGKRTYLSFTRPFDTCDPEDFSITTSLMVFIWAFGETDKVQYHLTKRGSSPVYLLDPEISEETAHDYYRQLGPHSNLYLVQRWALGNTIRISSKPSSAWCSVQRGPRLSTRHDIVGMGPFLQNDKSKENIISMFVYRCKAPQQAAGAEAFFEPYAKLKGEECYLNERKTLPLQFCRELIYAWGKGGEPFYFPEDIGIPIGESELEYYLLETRIDNPERLSFLEVESGVEIIFSHRLKPNAASLIQVGYGPLGIFMVPPKAVMNIYGSCGPKCTAKMLPKNGVNVFAVMLHSYSLGRSIRLRHFRSTQAELPWIIRDDNYDFEYQQMRLLPQERNVLPGDQLITQCTFDSHEKNRTIFSGFSSQDETCSAFVYVSQRIPYFRCTSEYPAERLMQKYGVNNFTWDLTWQDRYVTDPKPLEGAWLGDVIDEKISIENPASAVQQIQQDLQYSPHYESCPNINEMMGEKENELFKIYTNNWQETQKTDSVSIYTPHLTSTVSYPQNVQEYIEPRSCGTPIYEEKPEPIIVPVVNPPDPNLFNDFSFPDVPPSTTLPPPRSPQPEFPLGLPPPPPDTPLVLQPHPPEFRSRLPPPRPEFPSAPPPPHPDFKSGPLIPSLRPEFPSGPTPPHPDFKTGPFEPSLRPEFPSGPQPPRLPPPPPPPPPPPIQKPYEGSKMLVKPVPIKPADITGPLIHGLTKVVEGSEALRELTYNEPIKAFFDRLADLLTPKDKDEPKVKYKQNTKFPVKIDNKPPKNIVVRNPNNPSQPYFNEVVIPGPVEHYDVKINHPAPKSAVRRRQNKAALKAAEHFPNGFSYQSIRMIKRRRG